MPSEALGRGEDIFQCRQCGDCCRGYGGTYVSDADIAAIARYLELPEKILVSQHCCISGGRLLLAQGQNGYCAFWADGLCGIHPVKPRMCRQWPYLNSVLVDVDNWWAMASCCPGMRTDVSPESVRACVKAVREENPDL
ncbi:MAG: YkgJ family cysteine cluster protein [Pseudomonadota bacterium]